MKMERTRRLTLWTIITVGILLGLLFMMNVTVFAADKTITGLGTNTIANPSWGGGGWSYVYYGNFDSRDQSKSKYRVLDKCTNSFGSRTMLLDCDRIIIFTTKFDSVTNESQPTSWAASTVKDILNGTLFLAKDGNFTTVEISAIANSTKTALLSDESEQPLYVFAPLNGEKIFLLDVAEVLSNKYGYSGNDESRKKTGGGYPWWLRSSYSGTNGDIACVNTSGVISVANHKEQYNVSPAFNVSLSSIISSSLISGTAGAPGAEYKLTLKDTTMAVHPGSVTRSDTTITIPYTVSSNATQISVIMTNGSWSDDTGWSDGAELKYYKKLEGDLSGSGSFVLPQNYDTGWKTYLIAEAVKSGYLTDYASKPVAIQVPTESTPVPTQTLEAPQESPLTPSPVPVVVEEPITILKAPASVKATAKKNKVTVTWKKIKKTKKTKALLAQIKSVQVQYSTDQTFTQNTVTKTVGKNKTKAVLKLQKKTTYYVRVRYKGADGVSRWSGKKRIKTK